MTSGPIRAVLFDWGHTLFDTAASVDFIVQWSGDKGVAIDSDEARHLWDSARRRSRTAEELAKGRDKDVAIHRQCWTALWHELDALCPGVADALYEFETSAAGWSPYVDTPDTLRALRERGIATAIVSDVPFDVRPILAHYGLAELIDEFVLSGEHGTVKSEMRLFGIALQAVQAQAAETLMVGDNNVNDGAAIEVGIRTLLLPQVAHGAARGLSAVIDLVDGSRD